MPLAIVAASIVLQGPVPPIPDLVKTLPPPMAISVMAPKPWAIVQTHAPAPSPYEVRDSLKGIVVRLAGHKVAIRPEGQYEHVDAITPGDDGSLEIQRGHRDINWSSEFYIYYMGLEKPVPYGNVTVYRNRLNYAGSSVDQVSAIGMPETAPKAYVVESGRYRNLGWGDVHFWGSDGFFALEVPVDDANNPSGNEFTTGNVTRLLSRHGQAAFPGLEFLAREKDGTAVLVSGAGAPLGPNGYVYLGKHEDGSQHIVRWRDGQTMSHWILPPKWKVVGRAPAGWFLVRKEKDLPPFPMPKPGDTREAIQKLLARDVPTGEEDWTMGILRDGSITPIQFTRPKGTERLLWRNYDEQYGVAAFRIHVFYGNDDRWFRLAART